MILLLSNIFDYECFGHIIAKLSWSVTIQERPETESFTFIKVYPCPKDVRYHRLYTLYLLQMLSDGMFKSRLLAIVISFG